MEATSSLKSSIGRKFIMALSGAALVGFIIMHLLGNLSLLDSSGHAFNLYVKSLHDFGLLLVVAEIGLAAVFILHIVMAFTLTANYKAARPVGYVKYKSKGGPSKSSLGSRNMIITGAVLLTFLVWHIWQFRFGPSLEQGYLIELKGEQTRDLFRLVSETFSDPLNVAIYVLTMIFLALHIRHGFWSMFQSLGIAYPRWSSCIYGAAYVFALLLSLGFIILPIAMYLHVGG